MFKGWNWTPRARALGDWLTSFLFVGLAWLVLWLFAHLITLFA